MPNMRSEVHMNRRNKDKLRDATAKAIATLVRRTLDAARIQGWDFPDHCDIGTTIKATTPLVIQAELRMDDVTTEALISSTTPGPDISKAVNALVEPWLKKHATKRPGARLHRI
jgi:hypothetical protein